MMALTTGQKVVLLLGLPVTGLLVYLLFKQSDDEEEDEGKSRVVTSRQAVIEVKVPKECAGAIIGTQGSRIKMIQESTGARVNFKDEVNSNESERVVVIRGTHESAQQAELEIRKAVADQPVILSEEIFIPAKATGRIIGRGGETVRYLSRVSKARINVDRDEQRRADNMKRVTIKGSRDAIDNAKGLIQEKVAEEEKFRARTAVMAANRPHRGGGNRSKESEAVTSGGEQQVTDHNGQDSSTNYVNGSAGGESPSHRFPGQDQLEVANGDWPQNREYLEVYVSAVEHPQHFWVQVLSAQATGLDSLIADMTSYYSKQEAEIISPSDLKVGDVVAAPFPHDSNWYRARICQIKNDGAMFDLYFVDFGDNGLAQIDSVRPLLGEYLSLPFQALECSLANVKPSGESWSDEAVDSFEELTYTAKWKVVMAKIVSYRQIEEGHSIPCVELTDTNQPQDVNVAEELIKQCHAVSDKEDSTEFCPPPPAKTISPQISPMKSSSLFASIQHGCDN